MKYYLIVGEASGDLHASHLMRSLRAVDKLAEFRFFGGDLMSAVGGTRVKHYRELAYMGFVPVLLHLRTIFRNMALCKRDIVEWQPDVVILVDYPGFNLGIAKFVKAKTSIPVYYYISPKIWAWKEYRIKNIKRDVDEMLEAMLKAGYHVYITTFQDERAIDLSSIAPRPHLTIVNSFIEAMQTAYIKKQHIVVTGSLHFISRVRKYLIDLQTQDTKNQ